MEINVRCDVAALNVKRRALGWIPGFILSAEDESKSSRSVIYLALYVSKRSGGKGNAAA